METAIREEIQRAKRSMEATVSEPFGSPVERVKHPQSAATTPMSDEKKFLELEGEIRDLHITNRVKDMFIEQLKSERKIFLDKLLTTTQKVGELETRLHQLEEPKHSL